ncbi:hypothetical protein M4D55_17120 [Metabacillus idriensis]|uniref:hypothetical protein n=1 Tax=Metabacillus idriensis TaxID=324768 RepID=UPI00203CB9E1|nr:hypothetical protein [Metabacillus idriensis]MCM3597495.1 hypothetical protein [Metabacillus idriensis]
METIKLKTISVKDLQTTGDMVRESLEDKPLLLKIGEIVAGKTKYYHFQVHREASVEILYETKDKLQIVRILFDLLKNEMSIQSFLWTDETKRYEEAPIQNELIASQAFQAILQSITFTGNEQQSYLFQLNRK